MEETADRYDRRVRAKLLWISAESNSLGTILLIAQRQIGEEDRSAWWLQKMGCPRRLAESLMTRTDLLHRPYEWAHWIAWASRSEAPLDEAAA